MAIVDIQGLMRHAALQHYSLPVVQIATLHELRQAIQGAEQAQAPLVLTLDWSQQHPDDYEIFLPAVEAAANLSDLPISLLAINIQNHAQGVQAIRLGCAALMGLPSNAELNDLAAHCGITLVEQGSLAIGHATQFTKSALQEMGAAEQAPAALSHCTPWAAVEHLIIYNVSGADDAQVELIMARGREMLGAIPGVRYVFTGRTVKDESRYRYSWLVRFVHPKVIDSYRDHPAHVEFANTLFRPVAADRISIDFLEVATIPVNVPR